jgi:hypothetical protein
MHAHVSIAGWDWFQLLCITEGCRKMQVVHMLVDEVIATRQS